MSTSTPTPKIENFNELVEPHLNGSKIISYQTQYLTKPGDNYGSIMLAVSATIQKPNNIVENLELVAKIPPRNEIYWKIFDPERTCPTENSIYCRIAPIFETFQSNANVAKSDILDVFPKCYGARLSLDNKIVDKNAVLLLENLITNEFKLASRVDGLDYNHIRVVLKNLAKFHAIPIAYRNAHPNEFHEQVLTNLKRYNINLNFNDAELQGLTDESVKDIKSLEMCTDKLIDQVNNLIELGFEYMANPDECNDGPFNTIAHYDFWVNNMLFKYDENQNPVEIKIVDYQISQYESLAHDVLFVIFSSVQTSIINENYEELLKYYYKEFIKSLKLVGCPTNEYSLDLFFMEIKRLAPIQFSHVLFMLKVLMVNKDIMPNDFAEMDMNITKKVGSFDQKYFNKLRDFILLYQKFDYM